MRTDLLDMLACPMDGHFPLQLYDAVWSSTEIVSGRLVCPACGRSFPIAEGIPRLVLDDGSWLGSGGRPADQTLDVEWLESEARWWDDQYVKRNPPAAASLVDGIYRGGGNRLLPREQHFFQSLRRYIVGKVLLEIGSGDSSTVRLLCNPADLGYRYVATDIAVQGLYVARQHMDGDYVQCAIERMPMRPAICDVLLLLGVLHHSQEKEVGLLKLSTLVKDGGLILLYEPFGRSGSLGELMRRSLFWIEESEHEERLLESRLRHICDQIGEVILWEREYSPLRTALVLLFGRAMEGSRWLTAAILWMDKLFIRTVGRRVKVCDAGSVFAVVRRQRTGLV